MTTNQPGTSETDVPALKWEVRQRLTLIEATAFWAGRLTTRDLTGEFGISRVQATKDLALYQALCPGNLRYDRSQKAYLAEQAFRPRFCSGSAAEYLHLLRGGGRGGPVLVLMRQMPHAELLEPPRSEPDPQVLRLFVRAAREGRYLAMEYGAGERTSLRVAPHTLVHNGFRWHARAFSEGEGTFRDVVLGRVRGVPRLEGYAAIGREADERWNRRVIVELAAHPGLPPATRAAVEEEFGMDGGTRRLEVRAALLDHLLRLLGIGPDREGAMLALLNREALALEEGDCALVR